MIAAAVLELNLMDHPEVGNDITFNWFQPLMIAMECRVKEIEFLNIQRHGQFSRGDPSTDIIQQFDSKAIDIIKNIPKVEETLHIAFNQVPHPPFPFIVLSYYPSLKEVDKVIRLPTAFQITPFSKESFHYVWLRIAFNIHLGKADTGKRVRPTKITIPDTHGNRSFALFLRNILKNTDTNITCISDSKVNEGLGYPIAELTSELTEMFIGFTAGYLYDADAAYIDIIGCAQQNCMGTMCLEEFDNSNDYSSEDSDHFHQAEQYKARGNKLFQSKDFVAAMKYYSVAIRHMIHIIDHNDTTYKLLGTLLSNRAMSFLSFERNRSSSDFRQVLVSNAFQDCNTVLKSSWASSSLPESILKKLYFRRDRASARYDALISDFGPFSEYLHPHRSRISDHGDNTTTTQSNGRVESEHTDDETGETKAVDSSGLNDNKIEDSYDALLEYGEVIFKERLVKNAQDGCPICFGEFCGELSNVYAVGLPCGEHALCINCVCKMKIEADKTKQLPQCPLCRYEFNPEFVENLARQIVEVDQGISKLIGDLPFDSLDEKVDVAVRLLWTNRFDVHGVIDSMEILLDDQASGSFFTRDIGDLSHKEKNQIYHQARAPVEKLQQKLNQLLEEKRNTMETQKTMNICNEMIKVRSMLSAARQKSREDIYTRMNSVGAMGAQQDNNGGLIQIDFHGLHVNEMRIKFKEQIIPILPVVKKVMVITGQGLHSAGNEGKLKKALFKLIAKHQESMYWQTNNRP